MRRAELLLERLKCTDVGLLSAEPLALDESKWFLTAVERRLIEFGGERPHHLRTPWGDGELALQRELVPCIAAFARAVVELGYAADRASLLRRRTVHRRRIDLNPIRTRSDVELRSGDGRVHLQIKAMPSRQHARRLASALDAAGMVTALPEADARTLACVRAAQPRYLWLVGPNTVAPEAYVFRVRGNGTGPLERVAALPAPR